MAKQLPNVNRLVAEVLSRVETEKTAQSTLEAAAPQDLTTPIAQGLAKLAQRLRTAAVTPVSFEDVQTFADTLMGGAR